MYIPCIRWFHQPRRRPGSSDHWIGVDWIGLLLQSTSGTYVIRRSLMTAQHEVWLNRWTRKFNRGKIWGPFEKRDPDDEISGSTVVLVVLIVLLQVFERHGPSALRNDGWFLEGGRGKLRLYYGRSTILFFSTATNLHTDCCLPGCWFVIHSLCDVEHVTRRHQTCSNTDSQSAVSSEETLVRRAFTFSRSGTLY